VAQEGTASACRAVCAANRLSFLTTRSLWQEGQAIFVSERMSSSNEELHFLHSYS